MTRRLTVASVAYPLAPVGAHSVGGAEQMVHLLDHALVAAGHRSIVIAREDSVVAGELLPIPHFPGPIDDAMRRATQAATRDALRDVRADIVHMHGIDFADYLPPAGLPTLATLHLPPEWYTPEALCPSRPGTWVHCVSTTQHAACPPSAALLPPISNGVPVAALQASCHIRRSFTLMLGRICPEKAQHLALEAARLAGVPLLIAGEAYPYPAHQAYLRDEILPRLDHIRRLIGPIGFTRKRRLLAAARCVLIPSLAPETSSLVAMEAIACGTPVIAFRTGALPEIVSHGETGFIVDDAAGMAAMIARVGEIDPEHCRATARARFSLERCVDAYLTRYADLATAHVA